MRTNVTFTHPAALVPFEGSADILAADGAAWFVALLRQIPGLEVDGEPCQEDWGVAVFAERGKQRFWIGLSCYPEVEEGWLAHVHHAPWALKQRFTAAGRQALADLARDLDHVLKGDGSVAGVQWSSEVDMKRAAPDWQQSPS